MAINKIIMKINSFKGSEIEGELCEIGCIILG
jgi:hypothetical protein